MTQPRVIPRPGHLFSGHAGEVDDIGLLRAEGATVRELELIDLKYDVTHPPERALEVERERRWALDTSAVIVDAASQGLKGFTPSMLAQLRR